MPSTDLPVGEPVSINKEYIDIIRSEVDVDKKFIDKEGIPVKIIYFCKDCEKLVMPKRVGKKFRFNCTECKGKDVSFGPESSIRNYYKIPEGADSNPKAKFKTKPEDKEKVTPKTKKKGKKD